MSFLSKYKTSEELEVNGVWVDFGDGVCVKIARFSNPHSKEVRSRLERPHAQALRRGSLPDSVSEYILLKQMAEAIIVDWKGVTDENGAELECTYDNKLSVLKKFKDFRDDVAFAAMERDTFKSADVEDAGKNSKKS